MIEKLKPVIYLGWDSRESVATDVAAHSIRRHTRHQLEIKYLKHKALRLAGFLHRPWLIDGNGEMIDIIDGRPFSTEYSHSRFLIPTIMGFQGWAIYSDGDTLFTTDIKNLFELMDSKYAVVCVKHNWQNPVNTHNLEGRMKNQYSRKNWSSLMLINCSHPSNRVLSKGKVNLASGEWLHGLCWLRDDEIGEIPKTYNYISGISPPLKKDILNRPILPDHIHYTEGGPWGVKQDVQFSDVWIEEYETWCRDADHFQINSVPKTIYDKEDKIYSCEKDSVIKEDVNEIVLSTM